MRSDLRQAYKQELALAASARRANDLEGAVAHLERAHILGQRYLLPHLHTHGLLLAIAVLRADAREVMGQITRLIAVLPGYLSGWVPKGNTGSANVSALLPMKPPDDLAPLVASHSVARDVAMRAAFWGIAAAAYWLLVAQSGAEVFRDR